MEILDESRLKQMQLDDVCKIRKALNRAIKRIRHDLTCYECNQVDHKYYKLHLWYSSVVDSVMSKKLRNRTGQGESS